mgnify:FL=1
MALDLSRLDAALADEGQSLTPPTAPLAQFEEDPNNPRFEFDDPDFELFVQDVKEHGILQPVVVRRNEATGLLRIRFGARRYRAAVRLQLEQLPYFVTEDERQFDDFSQVSENEQRKNLQPLELAAFLAKKVAAGMTKKHVADKLKIDPSAVTHLLSLRDAPSFIHELYHSRKCRSPKYLYTVSKLHEQNAEIVERRCAEADEIDKAFLLAIAAEIEPPKISPPAGPTDSGSVLGSGAQAGTGAGDGSGPSSAPHAPAAPTVQQLPAHNPAIEKQAGSKPSDPSKLKKPLLLGTHKDRPLMLVLDKRPKAAGFVLVRYEDGSAEDEVLLAEIVLSLLTEAAA